MAKRTVVPPQSDQVALPLDGAGRLPVPPFKLLLEKPAVKTALPSDFNKTEEAEHLISLWKMAGEFDRYGVEEFVHAGGAGIVFRVVEIGTDASWALKVPRKKALQVGLDTQLSAFSAQEITALRQVSHPNVVRLHEQITSTAGVVGLVTTYVDDPQALDEYLRQTLSKHPDPKKRRGISPVSPKRLDNACSFLVERFVQVASALSHMHERGLYHCDVKSANILIGSSLDAILTDLGSCVSLREIEDTETVRIKFTWTYAHPDLHDVAEGDVKGISGGGLKVSAKVKASSGLARYDLFALGRTMQEALAELVKEFGERCYASYGFRFLHIIAALLLDGKNAPVKERTVLKDRRHFISDVALDYPVQLFEDKKITTAKNLLERLRRFDRDYSWNGRIRELDPWQPDYVNTGVGPAPYTDRIASILTHPAVRRLRNEPQLGWTKEVYPGATHSRWSHTLGVLANVVSYYSSLLSDPELPTARILLDEEDIETGLVAAILHDIGQSAFGHDLEAVSIDLFDHRRMIEKLLDDADFGAPPLRKLVESQWQNVSVSRVLAIIGAQPAGTANAFEAPAVDGLASDMIDGPIDADKLDYLIRDSTACGVLYGVGIDRERFLKTLTVDVKVVGGSRCRLALAYRAKGTAAVESLTIARYQMYSSVYWHHTYRCIQAMFVDATVRAFRSQLTLGDARRDRLRDAFYEIVICRRHSKVPGRDERVPLDVGAEGALEYVWRFANGPARELIQRLAGRKLYKRVYEVRTGELGTAGDYSALRTKLAPAERVPISEKLQEYLIRAVEKKMAEKHGPTESASEHWARESAKKLRNQEVPLTVIDYPVRGIPDEKNIPREIGDAARKYISGRVSKPSSTRDVFGRVRQLQTDIATLRVFAEPELHELVVRYMSPDEIEDCVFEAMPFIRTDR